MVMLTTNSQHLCPKCKENV